jgi:hypothetical protein
VAYEDVLRGARRCRARCRLLEERLRSESAQAIANLAAASLAIEENATERDEACRLCVERAIVERDEARAELEQLRARPPATVPVFEQAPAPEPDAKWRALYEQAKSEARVWQARAEGTLAGGYSGPQASPRSVIIGDGSLSATIVSPSDQFEVTKP